MHEKRVHFFFYIRSIVAHTFVKAAVFKGALKPLILGPLVDVVARNSMVSYAFLLSCKHRYELTYKLCTTPAVAEHIIFFLVSALRICLCSFSFFLSLSTAFDLN